MTQLLEHAPLPTRSTQLSTRWAWTLGLGWPVAYQVMLAMEPRAAQPTGVAAAIGLTLVALFVLSLVATTAAAMRRHRATPLFFAVTGGVALAMVISCPTTGHHPHVGAWFYGQLAICAGMLAVARSALQNNSR